MNVTFTHISALTLCLVNLLQTSVRGEGMPVPISNPSTCGLGLLIPDFDCSQANVFTIPVTNAPGFSLGEDVYLREVRLIVLHEWAADLDISLVSPSGVSVELTSDNGGGNDNYGSTGPGGCLNFTSFVSNLVPNSCNISGIASGHPPFIGEFLPENSLGLFNDQSSPLGNWSLVICDDGKEHIGTLEYVELVFEAKQCFPPFNVSVTAVDSTSARLDWTDPGDSSPMLIEFGPAGSFIPASGGMGNGQTMMFNSTPPVWITGLLPSTSYEFYLRKNCGAGLFSENTCKNTFETSCAPPNITLQETFNNLQLCPGLCGVPCPIAGSTWWNASTDDFDWTVFSGTTPTTNTGPTDDVPGGGKYIYIETSGQQCRNGNEAVLMSNCIEVEAGGDNCDMSFDYIMHGANVNMLSLQVSKDGGLTWYTLWQETGNKGDSWHRQFVDLTEYDGQVVQFRFIGKGGNGIRGDIALDNILFYGAADLGFPQYVSYRDEDGDGYGRDDIFYAACSDVLLPGFVNATGDCDDSNFDVNPAALELPCNMSDENCNGLDDDLFIPGPAPLNDTICSGETGLLGVAASFGGSVEWYDAATNGNLLGEGATFSAGASFSENNTPDTLVHVFYAEEVVAAGCYSQVRTAVKLFVLPSPAIYAADSPLLCPSDSFDLSTLNLIDTHGVNGALSFHESLPADSSNLLPDLVAFNQTTTLYARSVSPAGCSDTAEVQINIKPGPAAHIIGDTLLCVGATGALTVLDNGAGVHPLLFDWNVGANTSQIAIQSQQSNGLSTLYEVLITAANGCKSTDKVLVKTVSSIDLVQVNVEPVSSCNGSDGSILLSPLDGVPPYHYSWNGGSLANQFGTLNLSGLPQGAYSFTITDSSPQACEFNIPVVVVNGPSAVVTDAQTTPVSCAGGADGCIHLSVIGINPVVNWSNGASGLDVCGLAAGEYTVTVTDGACSNILNIPVTEPQELFAKANVVNIGCNGDQSGAIGTIVIGGIPPYQFLWSTGHVTPGISNLAPGNYTVTVSDARGCSVVLSPLAVTQPAPLNVGLNSLVQPTCNGNGNGKMVVAAQGGNGSYSYAWNNGGAANTITNLSAGNYQVTVIDELGCSVVQSFTLPQPAPININLDEITTPQCLGIDNGGIEVTVSGGNGNYQYSWNGTPTTQEDISGLSPGSYSLQVTDLLGCTAAPVLYEVLPPSAVSVQFDKLSPTCNGIDNGSIKIASIAGGQAPFDYVWSNGQVGNQISGLSAGNYSITIEDAQGCQFTASALLNAPQVIDLTFDIFPPACNGSATGQLVAFAEGGSAPYEFQWSHGASSGVLSNLSAGTYAVTVTDKNGCKIYAESLHLTDPQPLSIVVNNVESIGCSGGQEGGIEVSTYGGTLPYQFNWSSGHITEDVNNLQAGTYVLTVTDAKGCVSLTGGIEVDAPAPIQASANLIIPPGCQAVEIDTVCLAITGGVFPYSFDWSSGDTTACQVDVQAGDYQVTVTDAAGCTHILASVKVPEQFIPVKVVPFQPFPVEICHDASNGELKVEIVGGSAPFQYIWSNGSIGISNDNVLSVNQLSQGQYKLTITDAGGCTAVSPWLTVNEIPKISISATGGQIQHVKCKSGMDGAVNVNVSGGRPPYLHAWTSQIGDTIALVEDISGLSAGTYYLHVEDTAGCSGSFSVNINEPSTELTIFGSLPQIQNVICQGGNTGSVNITPTGGKPPYNYLWSNGKLTQDIGSLTAGVYSVTVIDANGCQYNPPSFWVLEPDSSIYLSEVVMDSADCHGEASAAVQVDLAGGEEPYLIIWNQSFFASGLTDIPAGTYLLEVYDAKNCYFDTLLTVPQPDSLQLATQSFPASPGSSDGMLFPQIQGGVWPYTLYLNGVPQLSIDTIFNLPAGFYELLAVDKNDCQVSQWVEVESLVNTSAPTDRGKLLIFPNPAGDWIKLQTDFSIEEPVSLSIHDMLGSQAFQLQMTSLSEGVKSISLPPGLVAGAYWLDIRSSARVYARQLLLLVR